MNDIKNRLNLLWPGFYHTKNKDFWTAQWEKHGTCSGKGVKDYFQQAMDLASQVQEDLAAAAQFLLGTNLFFEYMTFYYVLQFSFEVLLVVNYFLSGMTYGYHQPNMAMEIKLIQCHIFRL